MKRCPNCNRTYTDDALSFCLDDGSPLVNAESDPNATLVYPPPRDTSPQPPPPPSYNAQPPPSQNQYGAPPPPSWGPTPPPAPARKKSALPWIIGGLVVGVVFIIGAIVVLALIGASVKKSSDNGAISSNLGSNSSTSNSSRSTSSTSSDDLLTTKWSGPDNDDNKTRTYEFLSGGDLRMTGEDGTVYCGTWTQTGKTLHIDINGYTREGNIQGQRIEGTGVVQGRPFKWYAVKSSEAASTSSCSTSSGSSSSSSTSSANLLGTSWRGPDSDDHLNRTYDFQSGGDLKMTGQDGTAYHGQWTQSGSTLHIDINGYTREGQIVGNRINGTGVVQGRSFTWYATRQ
ncbi:MAG: hypothetical protein AUG51_12025 [Acidobacteria bacterium 13_1_20CM_3_53_8]|nr:MAG: hypothetical protein AUG51_12025 [Acidobacteria bacterium 13_1_20CM_3_53_8]